MPPGLMSKIANCFGPDFATDDATSPVDAGSDTVESS